MIDSSFLLGFKRLRATISVAVLYYMAKRGNNKLEPGTRIPLNGWVLDKLNIVARDSSRRLPALFDVKYSGIIVSHPFSDSGVLVRSVVVKQYYLQPIGRMY